MKEFVAYVYFSWERDSSLAAKYYLSAQLLQLMY